MFHTLFSHALIIVIFKLYCIMYYMLRFHISDSGNLVDVIFYSAKWPCQQRHPGTYWYGRRHKDMNKIVQSHPEIYLY